jgi:hypothetical protein
MTFVSEPAILTASAYNKFLIDHDAAAQSEIRELKKDHVTVLARILCAHHLENDLEIHLLHRHFSLNEGEAMVHWEITCPSVDSFDVKLPSLSIDIAKAMKCPGDAGDQLRPIMWYAADSGTLLPYEYAVSRERLYQRRGVSGVSMEKLSEFAKEFSAAVWVVGLENLVSLKDKSCSTGGEYVAPDIRSLFRIPFSAITLQPQSGVTETGWTLNNTVPTITNQVAHHISPSPDIPFPQPTDGHVTQTKQTTGGTVATHHTTTRYGDYAFDPQEVSPVYTDRMWMAAEATQFGSWNVVGVC